MKNENTYKWEWVLSIGEHIQGWLEDLEWDLKKMAKETELSESMLQSLLKDKIPITEEIAEKLSNVAFPSCFWLRVDHSFKEYQAHKETENSNKKN